MVRWRLYRTVVVFDVNVVREFWNGAESARCRFFCDCAPRANCDVMPNDCEKPRRMTQLDGGANCAHGHNLLFEQKNINERVQNAFQR